MTKTPRQKRHKKTKESILQVAEALVVSKGHEGISLREIAREAEYSPAGLYEYFDSKDALLRALAERVELKIIDALNEVSEDVAPYDRLLGLAEAYIRFALDNQRLYQLMSSMSAGRASLDEAPQTGYPYGIMRAAIAALVESEKGTIPALRLEELTYGLWAFAHGMISLRLTYLKNFKADFEAANRNNLILFIDGIKEEIKG